MLTNAVAKAAGAQARAYKLHDAGGLFLFVAPTGTKSWRLKYRWRGREKLLTIGRFPDVNLAQARMRREEAKAALRDGADPGRSVDIKVNTFEQLARQWHAHMAPSWSPAHASDVLASLERDVFPDIGNSGIAEIGAPCLLNAMHSVEQRGCIETARRIRQRLSAIFGFAVAQGLIDTDPAALLGRAMQSGKPAQPHPALTTIGECRTLIDACKYARARVSLRLASEFLALTAVRLDAVRGARWDEIEGLDGTEPLWRVPAARMKLARAKKAMQVYDHIVPLSAAAVAVLREVRLMARTGDCLTSNDLVFSGRTTNKPIGESAIGALYVRAGYRGRHVPHGWRASFSTIMNEDLGPEWRGDIDRALAHVPKDKVEAAYNRAQLLDRRRAVLDRWGELMTGMAETNT